MVNNSCPKCYDPETHVLVITETVGEKPRLEVKPRVDIGAGLNWHYKGEHNNGDTRFSEAFVVAVRGVNFESGYRAGRGIIALTPVPVPWWQEEVFLPINLVGGNWSTEYRKKFWQANFAGQNPIREG